ncbi:hypothetical protein AAIR98_000908 [Elusimicrobium simillimum]|uniref:phage tail assembly chaperone n=1 Tax=Elusimicrobium simillimum TaxID=3143438 RepID=UPI003C6FC6F5
MELSNNQKVTLPSNAEIDMTLAPFEEGNKLFTSVAECLKSVKIDANKDLENIEDHINALKNAFLECITSKDVKDSILLCLKRCSYNGKKIQDWSFFDDVKMRADYLPVCWEVSRFNLAPFMSNLFTKLQPVFQVAMARMKERSPQSK